MVVNADRPVYGEDEGVGLELGNSSAYFLNGYKIVKNNIPYGDNIWHLYHLPSDPGETNDMANSNPVLFLILLSEYEYYANAVEVIQMPEGYRAENEVWKKSLVSMAKTGLPFLLVIVICIVVFILWLVRRKAGTFKEARPLQ